jgi:Ser/Thr protein kinase RdoA (MazF antagonist)
MLSVMTQVQPPLFPASGSLPCARALVADILVGGYGLSPVATCRFHHFGLNDTFVVESDSKKFVLRIYRARWRSATDIHYELEALDHLATNGVLVSTAIPRLDRQWITTIAAPEGDRSAVLFTFAPGRELKDDPTDSADFGRSCAQLHAAADDFSSRHERFALDLGHLLDQPLAQIQPHVAHRAKDWDFLRALADRLRQRVAAVDLAALDRGFCHGDFHGGNVHREGDRLTHFDFDCCGYGCRAYDIAVYRWASRLAGKESELQLWPAYLAGYRAVRQLAEADLSMVDLFVPIRHIWLMGMHLHGGPRWGFGWLGEKYLDRHMKLLREMGTQYLDNMPLFATA